MNHTFKFTLVGALCALPTIAQACSCIAPPAPEVALGNSAAVFVGRVTSVEKSDFSNKYQFSVSKQWKGVQGNAVSIVSATSSAACGINFDEDRDYLVYAYKNEGEEQLRTNLCSRTARAADAASDLAALGAPVKSVAASTNGATGEATTGKPNEPLDMSQYYRVADNGDIQVNSNPGDDPLVALGKALKANQSAQRFRVNWTSPMGDSFMGTSLYNRANSTLKSYSRVETGVAINVSSVLYSGVTDEVLQKLASTEKVEEFFRTYANYGVSKKDVGSKTVRMTG